MMATTPHSVVILDNCSVHHREETMIEKVGPLSFTILNPTEKAFSKVKATLQHLDQEGDQGEDPQDMVLSAFSSIS